METKEHFVLPSGASQSMSSFRSKTPSRTPGDSGGTVTPRSRPVTPTFAVPLPVLKPREKLSHQAARHLSPRLGINPDSEVKDILKFSSSSRKKSHQDITSPSGSARGNSRPNSRASCSSRTSSLSEGDLSETSDGPNAAASITPWSRQHLTFRSSHSKQVHSRIPRGTARSPASSEVIIDGYTSQTVFPPTTPDTVSESGSLHSSRISRNLPSTPSLSTDTLNDGVLPIMTTTRTHRILPATPSSSREAPSTLSRLPRPVTPSSDRGISGSTPRQQFKAPSKIPTKSMPSKLVSKPSYSESQ